MDFWTRETYLFAWHLYVGGNSVKAKTEADDITECSCDDQPSTGVFGFVICYHLR